MGLSKALSFTSGVSLVAALLVCLGALLCLLPAELDLSTTFAPADYPPLDRGAEEGYLAVLLEEADPVNADLLTMLLLGVSSLFGLSFGWELLNAQRQRTLCSLGVVGPSSASTCEDLLLLGVLRL